MRILLCSAALGLLALAGACRQQAPADPPPPAQNPATAARLTPPPPAAAPPPIAPDTALTRRLRQPRSGDVYVVEYYPAGGSERRYFFYQVQVVQPESVQLLPARQEATDAAADVSAAGFFTNKPMTYTRAEALELTQEQPGDVQHTRLVQVRRQP